MPSLWRTLYADHLTSALLSSEDRCRPRGQGRLDESDGRGEEGVRQAGVAGRAGAV